MKPRSKTLRHFVNHIKKFKISTISDAQPNEGQTCSMKRFISSLLKTGLWEGRLGQEVDYSNSPGTIMAGPEFLSRKGWGKHSH